MIISNIPSPSSTQTTAMSHNQFSSFANQPSSHYSMPPNHISYNPIPPYFLPVQQPVFPPSYSQASLSSYPYMLQQGNDPTCVHAPSDFPPPPNPGHLNHQYSVLPSHISTPILHQNPSLSCEQPPLPSNFSGTPHPYCHGLSGQPFPLHSSTDPNSVTAAAATATSHHSLNLPEVHYLTSQVSSMTTSRDVTADVAATATSHHSLNLPDVHSLTSQFSSMTTSRKTPQYTQSDSTRQPSSSPYHTKQSTYEQSFPPHHSRQSYTSNCDSTISAHNSLAPPSPLATTPSGVTTSPSTPANQHPLSPAMQRYVTYLKKVYSSIDTPVYDKEHSLLQVKAKSFINIALVHKRSSKHMKDSVRNEMIMDRLHGQVDAIQRKKTKLSIHDVCKAKDGKPARSVLVEGAPGVGKTTFANELSKRWARGKIMQEWAAVVLIKLRDHTTRTAQNMYDLLYHPRPEVKQAVVDELIDHDGECTLLILDGYDELTDSQKESTSVIQQIMSKKLLCQSTLMVTSRPLATRTLHDNFVQSIDQHIEVLGFTEKNIEEYIQSACGDKPELVEDFKSYLSSHPFSSALMFNPLQCAIVTDLYRSHWESGDKGFAPKTLTELYTGLVHIMLLRYLTQHPVYKDRDWWIKDLSDLPEKVSQQLNAVTELAAKGIRNQQYVFDEVNTKIPPETLGLMQKEEVVASGVGISTSHNFLHLTLQEYLAAVNYSQQYSSPEQLSQLLTQDDFFPLYNFLEYYGMERIPRLSSSATHWPVVLFVAGRTKLSGVPTNIFKTGLHAYYSNNITTVDISLLHLLYETQSPQLIQSTLVTSRKYLSVNGRSALDWFVIGYCIANSTSTWRVEKKGYDSPTYFDQLVMGLRLGLEECNGDCKIGSLHISAHWTESWKILSQLQQYAMKVTELKLVYIKEMEQRNPEISNRKLVSKEVSACYPMLEDLSIENVESSYFDSILSFISQHSNLHYLYLDMCNPSIATNSKESIHTSIHYSFLHTILQQNTLCILSLKRYILTCDTVRSLIHSLQSSHCGLQEVTLDGCIFDQTHSTTTELKLKLLDSGKVFLEFTGDCCDISHWLSQLSSYTQLTELILHLERQDLTVAHTLQEIILYRVLESLKIRSVISNKTLHLPLSVPLFIESQQNNLHTLSLSRCNLSSYVAWSLIHSLQSPHCRLHKLTIDHCAISTPDETKENKISTKNNTTLCSLFTTDSLCVLNQILSNVLFTQLAKLSLCFTTYNYSAAEVLKKIPCSCPVLETIKIDSDISISLPLAIPHFIGSQQNNLNTLSLRRCTINSDVTRSLINSLQSPHCKLYKLALYDCTIPTTDHTKLTTAIVNSTTITHLFIIDVNIDTLSSLRALASGLKHNTTIEELAVDKYYHDSTKDRFRLLIDAVDSSAVKKLWLNDHSDYRKWFHGCALSSKNVDIVWYSYYHYDLFNKW